MFLTVVVFYVVLLGVATVVAAVAEHVFDWVGW